MAPRHSRDDRLSVMLVPARRGETVSFQTTKRRLLIFMLAAFLSIGAVGFLAVRGAVRLIVGTTAPEPALALVGEDSLIRTVREEYEQRRSQEIAHYERLLETERGEREALELAASEMEREFGETVGRISEQVTSFAEMSALPVPEIEGPEVSRADDPEPADGRGGPTPGLSAEVTALSPALERAEEHLLALIALSESLRAMEPVVEGRRELLRSTPLAVPLEGDHEVTDRFGSRRHPITGIRDSHGGLDFSAPHGTPVIAPADGVVTFAGRMAGYGRIVMVDHGTGLRIRNGQSQSVEFSTRFAHLSRTLVDDGERVTRGQEIGRVGSSGMSTGSHLHYEVRIDGDPVNPREFIAGR